MNRLKDFHNMHLVNLSNLEIHVWKTTEYTEHLETNRKNQNKQFRIAVRGRLREWAALWAHHGLVALCQLALDGTGDFCPHKKNWLKKRNPMPDMVFSDMVGWRQ